MLYEVITPRRSEHRGRRWIRRIPEPRVESWATRISRVACGGPGASGPVLSGPSVPDGSRRSSSDLLSERSCGENESKEGEERHSERLGPQHTQSYNFV